MGLVTIVAIWDRYPLSRKMRFVEALVEKYSMNNENASVYELEHDLGEYICLLIPRLLAVLGTQVNRNGRYSCLVTCLSCFMRTSKGLDYTVSSASVLPLYLRALKHDEDVSYPLDVASTFRGLREISLCSNKIREYLINLGAMEMACVVLQKSYLHLEVQESASQLLIDLAAFNVQSGAIFSDLIRRLFLSPHLCTKHSAVQMLHYIYASQSLKMYFTDWAHELHVELCRMLLCSTLTYQYDAAALVSYLLCENDIGPLLMKTCTAVLCLRYIPGGGPLLVPSMTSENVYPELRKAVDGVFETLEIIVCSALLQCLCRFDICSKRFAEVSRQLRRGRLAKALLAHILWYSREKSVLQRIITLWTPFTTNEAEMSPQSKYRKACEVTKKYLARKLRRGGVMPTLIHHQEGDETSTLKDVVFANVVRILQDWIERDSVANADLEASLIQHGLKQFIKKKTFAKNATVDVTSTIIAINTHGNYNSSASQHPVSDLLRHLSSLLLPGDLVRSLKFHLHEAISHADDDTCSSISIPEARSLWWDSSRSTMATNLHSIHDFEDQICLHTPRNSIREISIQASRSCASPVVSQARSVSSPFSGPESHEDQISNVQAPVWMSPRAPPESPIQTTRRKSNPAFKMRIHSSSSKEQTERIPIIARFEAPEPDIGAKEICFDPMIATRPRRKRHGRKPSPKALMRSTQVLFAARGQPKKEKV